MKLIKRLKVSAIRGVHKIGKMFEQPDGGEVDCG